MQPAIYAQRAGLIAPSIHDIVTGFDLLDAAEGLSDRAWQAGIDLAEQADFLGEVCAAFTDREAVDELLSAGVLRSAAFTANGILLAQFAVNEEAYLGDDLNDPLDCFDTADTEHEPDDLPDIAHKSERNRRIYVQTRGRCFYCIVKEADTLDHKVPRVRGGCDDESNLVAACRSCNSTKRDRTVEEFRAYLSYKRRLPSVGLVKFFGERCQ